uniref:Uncharacterized protein n=1 Tax=Panagrolaimus sp. ES5 TaxID=591445 RepID=A0AC34F2H6_9BILA
MRFNLKEIDMLPSIGQCDSNSQGRATCFVNNWLKYKVIEQYNCSVFYLHHKRPDIEICDPEIIIKNYDTFVDPSLKDYACVPPCLRFDTAIEIYTAMEMAGPQGAIDSGTAAFRIEASYISLEMRGDKNGGDRNILFDFFPLIFEHVDCKIFLLHF